MKTTTLKKLTAVTATAMLGLGLAACSPANENPASSSAVESADAKASEEQQAREDANKVTETNVTTGTVTETASATGEGTGAEVATTTLTDANGNEVKVPEAIADKYEALGGADSKLGHVNEVKDYGDGQWLATFERDGYNHYLAYTPKTGAVLIHGEIAKQWLDAGAFASTVGAPTDEEVALTDGSGWEQSFVSGTISWVKDAAGTFSGRGQVA